ncbi:carbohydrate ABC transporter permease [Lachnotalea sp. AF33-28]|jgi:putative aldouronate transport system permease protein|uniref:carbohydrate ABC transporter permease n=1 Tax=Lachnotalea sp. AF33-28 TaxID=2292046 RepID=UPI000E531C41|nr:carbohydrate ABC transporter permease [Lachnotalea sp. AF33-28]RHP29110.1 carbohydrate ABC transporter permease [Lachnotalea sp. AF33-28]
MLNYRGDRTARLIANIVMTVLSVCALLPFLLLVGASFTEEKAAVLNGFSIIPSQFGLGAYQYILKEFGTIGRAYLITIVVTVVGTALSMTITTLMAYALTKRVPGVKILNFLVIFTMLFNGGLVPTYYVYSNILRVKDTIWALIVPGLLMNAFSIMLVKNYFRTAIPKELLESAKMDGAGQATVLTKIVLPLSTPILATIGINSALAYWNDWTNGLYYLTDARLFSLQTILNKINENVQFLANNSDKLSGIVNTSDLPTTTMRMAVAVIGILPVVFIFPFFQKYFIKGITIGAVKG